MPYSFGGIKAMKTSKFLIALWLFCLSFGTVMAADSEPVSGKELSSGLKAAIERGAELGVAQLGVSDGFLGNERVRIALPDTFQKAEALARKLGFSKSADELIAAMNHAAELAVVEAKPVFINAVKNLSFQDAKAILFGPPDAATQYFKRVSSAELALKFLPIIKSASAKVQVAEKFNAFAAKASRLGLISEKDANLDQYVTQKAMDGLFLMMAEQEKKIRDDPIGTGSSLLKKSLWQ